MSQAGILGGLFGRKKAVAADVGPLTEASIRNWLVDRLAKQLKVDRAAIDPAKRFDEYGLDSIVAVQVSGDLEKVVEQRLSPALLFEHNSIDDLARHLSTELGLQAA
ncbi:polyketide synthase [Burkholderia sp. Nafp2/4-1b]|uniref:acyl carrier protein n=1 Tax=Burkholderia sp. Nafp2/4-1b TaxID=2116686 RepID=UPI000EF8F848|nr:acyl carrier protein [Burkholderia sp. Nafp2/4-1b]RKU04050.1 polyketide synthase [Burkholderia sp. Nafp2/4-1b]